MAVRTPAPFLAFTLALALAASLPALAASSASSASSEGSSASSGSVSDSFGSSSDSSKTEKKVAEGDYRVVQIAGADQAGKLRLVLEGVDGSATGRVELIVPAATVQQAALVAGGTVNARERSYGWAFATGSLREAREPFFLVVHDAQRREFATTKVAI
jgi:hypothetical protein